MTPEEKAKELFEKYCKFLYYGVVIDPDKKYDLLRDRVKEAATISVDEILNGDLLWTPEDSYFIKKTHKKSYWEKVKEELSKL